MDEWILKAFDQHAAMTYDKQCHFTSLVDGLDGTFDECTGQLSFEGKYCWNAQILGEQTYNPNLWHWGWADALAGSNNLIAEIDSLRELGEETRLHELRHERISAAQSDGHFWAILATGLCDANAYYCDHRAHGTRYLLIKDTDFPATEIKPLARLNAFFAGAVCAYEIENDWLALASYATSLGLSVYGKQNNVRVQDREGNALRVQFDEFGRLVSLSEDGIIEIRPRRRQPTSEDYDRLACKEIDPTRRSR